MMIEDKIKWNKKYENALSEQKPSSLLLAYLEQIGRGEVLDIAAGMGRHAKTLAAHGCHVDAIEWSDVALESLAKIPGVNAIEMDLEEKCSLKKRYDAILCFNYLNRDLYPLMLTHLKSGGLLLFETFVRDDANEGTLANPSFLLEKNELLHVFCSLYIIEYKEWYIRKPDGRKALKASMAAKKPY
jgi:SAM-dependent methyltransferase